MRLALRPSSDPPDILPSAEVVTALIRWAHLLTIAPTERAKTRAMKAEQAADHANR